MGDMVKEIPHRKVIPFYRRKFLIDPWVQLRVVCFLGGIAVVCAFAICAIAYERLMALGVLFNNSMVPPVMLPQAFHMMAQSLMVRLIIIVVVMVVVFVGAGIVLTHQLAGPIWKLQKHLRLVMKGEDVPPMRFRRGDAFQDLPELVNKLVESCRK